MEDILSKLGLPIGVVIALVLIFLLARSTLKLITERRTALADEEARRRLDYLDKQLSEFYLPIFARLSLSKGLYDYFEKINIHGSYSNQSIGIIATNPSACRDIVVRRIYLPLNKGVEQLIIEKSHWKAEGDTTDYPAIVRHILLWSSLEEAILEGSIQGYDSAHVLTFPAKEADTFNLVCSRLIERRNALRLDVLKFRKFKG